MVECEALTSLRFSIPQILLLHFMYMGVHIWELAGIFTILHFQLACLYRTFDCASLQPGSGSVPMHVRLVGRRDDASGHFSYYFLTGS